MNHKPIPAPLPPRLLPDVPVELWADAQGFRWRLAEDGQDGRLFVAEHVDPASCPRLVWAREDELTETVGQLTRVERAA